MKDSVKLETLWIASILTVASEDFNSAKCKRIDFPQRVLSRVLFITFIHTLEVSILLLCLTHRRIIIVLCDLQTMSKLLPLFICMNKLPRADLMMAMWLLPSRFSALIIILTGRWLPYTQKVFISTNFCQFCWLR